MGVAIKQGEYFSHQCVETIEEMMTYTETEIKSGIALPLAVIEFLNVGI